MAGQEIITKFRADTSELTDAITKEEARVKALEGKGVSVRVRVDDTKLTASLGSLAQKFAVLETVAKRTGDTGKNAGENIAKGFGVAAKTLSDIERVAKSDLDLVRALIVEASKTPKGAEALAKDLNGAQQSALKALVAMGALSEAEAKVAADATKLIAAQKQLPPEVQKSAKEFVSLRTQMQNARNELARLIEASGGKLTPQIRAAAVAAGQLQDRFEDTNATINAFNPDKKFQAITGVIQNVAGGFTAMQGAIALAGGNSDELARSLLKVQAALAVTQGLQSLFGGLKDNLKIIRLLFSSGAVAAKELAAGEAAAAAGAGAQGAATAGLTGFLNGAKAAATQLWATLIANPFVAVAAALALVVGGIVTYISTTTKATETTDELIARLDKLRENRKFQIDRTAQEELIDSERLFLRDKEAALKAISKEEREAALARAEDQRRTRDNSIEQRVIEQQIAKEKKIQAEEQQRINELTDAGRGSRAIGGIGGVDEEELQKAKDAIAASKKLQQQLEVDLNKARGKANNEVLAAQVEAEEKRVESVRDGSNKVVKVQEDEAAKRAKIIASIQDIQAEGENEVFLASLGATDKALAELAQKFDERVARIRAAFDELRKSFGEGTPQADTKALAAITKSEGEAIAAEIRFQETQAQAIREQANADERAKEKEQADKLLKIQQDADEKRLAEIKRAADERNAVVLSSLTQLAQVLGEAVFNAGGERLAALESQHDAELDSIGRRFDKELALNAEANSGRAGLTRAGIQRQKELEAERAQAILDSDRAFNEAREREDEAFRKKQKAAIISALLDVLQVELTAAIARVALKEIGSKGFLGIATTAILSAVLAGFFAAAKAKLTGAYEGEALVGGDGRRPDFPGERDAYAYRLHKGERVVRARTNMRHFKMLEAMEDGKLDRYIEAEYVVPSINAYLKGDTGQRMAQSVMLAKYYDANIVAAQQRTTKKQDRTNELLFALLNRVGNGTSKRHW